jgi:NIPSNAP
MANRRDILAAAAGGVGLASLAGLAAAAPQTQDGSDGRRDLYELRRYVIDHEPQKQGFDTFLRDAAIPALNRIGITPVGVFHPEKELSPIYVLLRHRSVGSLLTSTQKLLADGEYLRKGEDFLNAPADKPAFQRMESTLLLAFKNMPTLETPVRTPGRIVQLRIYESPSVKTGQKKIEMFNDGGEIAIFRRAGLHPVFFGESLVGARMPNLTYMLAFQSADELKANWAKFGSDPEWKKLSKMPEYSDKAILCGITNLILKPAEYSQI